MTKLKTYFLDVEKEHSFDALCKQFQTKQPVKIEADNGTVIILPTVFQEMLLEACHHWAEGQKVVLVPNDQEVTTQQAADMLNVSRPYLISLLEEGEIRFKKVGTHRRIHVQDLLAYKKEMFTKRIAILDKLTRDAQATNMGY